MSAQKLFTLNHRRVPADQMADEFGEMLENRKLWFTKNRDIHRIMNWFRSLRVMTADGKCVPPSYVCPEYANKNSSIPEFPPDG